jgi:aspartate/tyrosine/aromatic aminotransferase
MVLKTDFWEESMKNSEMVQAQSLSGTGALYLMINVLNDFYTPL